MPLTEIRTRDEIASKLTARGFAVTARVAQQGFIFRGAFQQAKLNLKFFPEGFGLYLNRKKQLDTLGMAIAQRRTLIVMMGHRNLSILCFEGGSLKTSSSNSDGPGFWPAFEKGARPLAGISKSALGVTPSDYPALMAALTTGKKQQISQVRAGVYDFGTIAETVQQTYWQLVSIYLQDHLLHQLTDQTVDLIISGGAAHIIRATIKTYFEDLGLDGRFSFADEQPLRLIELVSSLPKPQPALP